MKKKTNTNSRYGFVSKNGLKVGGDIALSTDKPHEQKRYLLVKWFIAFLSTLSTLAITDNFVQTHADLFTLAFFSFLCTFAFSVLKSKNRFFKMFGFGTVVVLLLFVLINRENVMGGFLEIADRYMFRANRPDPSLGAALRNISADSETAISFFYLALSVIVGFGTSMACVHRTDFPLLFLFTFPVFELGMYWGWDALIWGCCAVVICWTVILSMNIINHTTNKAGRKNTFAIHERKKTFYFTSPNGKAAFNGVLIKFTALLTSLVFLCAILFSAATGFIRPEKLNVYRKQISHAFENFSLSNLFNDKNNIHDGDGFLGVKAVGGTNGGILGQTDGISFNGSTALKVELPKFDYPIYLTGRCAGEYKDNSWQMIKADENADYFKTFTDKGKFPQDLNNLCVNEYISESGDKLEEAKIKVEIVGADPKYVYAPYGSDFSKASENNEVMKMCEESCMVAQKKRYSISFKNLSPLFENGYDWCDLYKDSYYSNYSFKQEYTDYVNKNYLTYRNSQILNDAYEDIQNNYLPKYRTLSQLDEFDESDEYYEYDEEFGRPSYDEVYHAIHDYFSDEKGQGFKYTLTPGATPEEKDFIDDFLTKRKGYCSYFASAGVELLRMFGYPARYAEGYIILPEQYHEGQIIIEDRSAHAWAEVYIPGKGWIPAEFTPGYGDGSNRELDNKSNNKNDNSSNSSSRADSSSSKNESSSSTAESSSSSSSETSSSKPDSSSESKPDNSSSATDSSSENEHSSAVDGTNSQIGGSGTTDSGANKSKVPLAAIMLAVFIVASAAVILIRRYVLISKKKAELSDEDQKNRIKSIYKYTLKYLNLIGIFTEGNLTDMQLFEKIIEQCNDKNIQIDEVDLKTLFEDSIKAQMSDEDITSDQIKQAEFTMNRIFERSVLPNLSAYDKIKAKFIHCLY